MDADYSIELGPTAPALEVPWQDADGRIRYISLRQHPERIAELDEVRRFPALGRLLRALNHEDSAWETAKCDVWLEPDEVGRSEDAAEAGSPSASGDPAAFSQHCYVDLILSEAHRALRDSLAAHQALARRMARTLEEHGEELDATAAEIVLRRCYFHTDARADSPTEDGYFLTLYLSGFGATAAGAAERWQQALDLAAGCLPGLAPKDSGAVGGEVS